MSSLAVFLRFVHRDEEGNIDASRVVSRQCFDEWLSSKGENVPRDPEEAFRKALIGHCNWSSYSSFVTHCLPSGKGAHRMKPFEPEVEAALLRVLKSFQIWPCFARSKRKIGLLGIRVRGYWESRNSQTIIQGTLQSQLNPGVSLAVKKKNQKISRNEIEHLQAVWKTIKKMFGQRNDSKIPLWFLYLYRQTGFYGPVHSLSCRLPFDDNSLFYSQQFCLPATQEQHFVVNKIVGKFMTDSTTPSVIDDDDGARTIYQGRVDGKSLLNMWLKPAFYMSYVQQGISTLLLTNEIWARSLQRCNDGSVVVLLSRISTVTGCSTSALVEIQDVTDQFSQYM